MSKLKSYNLHLFSFLLLNLLLLGVGNYLIFQLRSLNFEAFITLVPLPSIIILSTFILNGILSSYLKYILVFLKIKNPLPASRLELTIKNDPRFSVDQVIKKFGPLPSDPKEQNTYWYQKIYKPHQNSEKIRDAHKKFLMTRDMTAICVMILAFSVVNWLFLDGTLLHIMIVLIEYLIIRFVSANYGRRFVVNTVAEAI